MCNGVWLLASRALISTPRSSNDFKVLTFPSSAAACTETSAPSPPIVIRAILSCVQCRGPYLVLSIWIRFVLGNEIGDLSLAILRCQLGCTSTGIVEHVDISTPPKQQLYNSEMPTSRRGVQYSPAVAVCSMHSRSGFDQEMGNRGIPIHYCSIERSFLPVIGYVDTCATLDQQLGNLEAAIGR